MSVVHLDEFTSFRKANRLQLKQYLSSLRLARVRLCVLVISAAFLAHKLAPKSDLYISTRRMVCVRDYSH